MLLPIAFHDDLNNSLCVCIPVGSWAGPHAVTYASVMPVSPYVSPNNFPLWLRVPLKAVAMKNDGECNSPGIQYMSTAVEKLSPQPRLRLARVGHIIS